MKRKRKQVTPRRPAPGPKTTILVSRVGQGHFETWPLRPARVSGKDLERLGFTPLSPEAHAANVGREAGRTLREPKRRKV